MKNRDLITALSQLPMDCEVVSWDSDVVDWMPVDSMTFLPVDKEIRLYTNTNNAEEDADDTSD